MRTTCWTSSTDAGATAADASDSRGVSRINEYGSRYASRSSSDVNTHSAPTAAANSRTAAANVSASTLGGRTAIVEISVSRSSASGTLRREEPENERVAIGRVPRRPKRAQDSRTLARREQVVRVARFAAICDAQAVMQREPLEREGRARRRHAGHGGGRVSPELVQRGVQRREIGAGKDDGRAPCGHGVGGGERSRVAAVGDEAVEGSALSVL